MVEMLCWFVVENLAATMLNWALVESLVVAARMN